MTIDAGTTHVYVCVNMCVLTSMFYRWHDSLPSRSLCKISGWFPFYRTRFDLYPWLSASPWSIQTRSSAPLSAARLTPALMRMMVIGSKRKRIVRSSLLQSLRVLSLACTAPLPWQRKSWLRLTKTSSPLYTFLYYMLYAVSPLPSLLSPLISLYILLVQVHMTMYDIKRLELYARNMADHHMILDLVPTLARLLFCGRLPSIRLSHLQLAVLLAIGLQHRSVDSIQAELDLPSNQVLSRSSIVSVCVCEELNLTAKYALKRRIRSLLSSIRLCDASLMD